jgi:hypothetical protein
MSEKTDGRTSNRLRENSCVIEPIEIEVIQSSRDAIRKSDKQQTLNLKTNLVHLKTCVHEPISELDYGHTAPQ